MLNFSLMKRFIPIISMNFIFPLFLIFISNHTFYGQKIKNDSYEDLRVKYEAFGKNDNKAMSYVQTFIQKAKHENQFSKLVLGYQDAIYFEPNKYLKLKYADSAITAAYKTQDHDLITSAYLGKGIIYYSNFRQYMPALNEYLKAFSYVKDSNNEYLHFKVVYHLGVVKSYLGYYREAINHFNDCIHYFETKAKSRLHPNEIYNHKKGYLNSLHQANVCYRNLLNHKKSDSLIEAGLKNSAHDNDFILEHNYFLKSKGVSLYFKKQYPEALLYLNNSLGAFKKVDDFSWVSVNYFFQGKSLVSMNQMPRAIEKFEKVDSIFNQHQFILPELRNNYEVLIDYYKKRRNTERQLYYMKQLLKADSIISKDFSYLSPKIHKEYDTKSLVEEKKKLEKGLLKRTIWVIALVSVSLLIGILYVIRYRRDRIVQSKYKLLEKKYKEALSNLDSISNVGNKFTSEKISGVNENQRKLGINKEIEIEIIKKLDIFEKNIGYIKKGLTLKTLATQFETNTYYLSWVINENKKVNFNKYLSDLRINYITRQLFTHKKYLNYTIEALAEECGIASRQNFSDLFYEINGIRPTDFIKQRKQEMKNT